MNGIRVATKRGQINPEDVGIYYFQMDKKLGDAVVDELQIRKSGKVNRWPDGFFDEWANMLDELI